MGFNKRLIRGVTVTIEFFGTHTQSSRTEVNLSEATITTSSQRSLWDMRYTPSELLLNSVPCEKYMLAGSRSGLSMYLVMTVETPSETGKERERRERQCEKEILKGKRKDTRYVDSI